MEKQYNEITKLVAKQGDGVAIHLCKLTEEVGELAQAINKRLGTKSLKKSDTTTAIRENIKEEISDCIQILFGIAYLHGISLNDLKKELSAKNKSYSKFLLKKKNK
jgi:NTP pyrophosphatase (non-canonical NTP hydrolase)